MKHALKEYETLEENLEFLTEATKLDLGEDSAEEKEELQSIEMSTNWGQDDPNIYSVSTP